MVKITADTIKSKQVWEEFVLSHPEANFLSSWNWGVFHQNLGKDVYYLGFFKKKRLIGVCLAVKETAKRGSYITVAGGPIIDWHDSELVQTVFSHLAGIAKNNKCLFVRIRPQIFESSQNLELMRDLGLQLSPMHLTADLTLQLNLQKTNEQLLAEMRKTTRYEIRRAEKIGISTSISKAHNDMDWFFEHQLNLARKHNFVPFSKTFLKEQFSTFVKDDQVILVSSYYQDQLLATAFVIFYGQEAVYHYGISTPANQKLPGSYACQWRAILEAKKRGLNRYNFWGIAPQNASPDHRFAGVTLFKKGFGGQEVAYLPAHDLPTSPYYRLVYLFERMRAKTRRLQ